MTENNLNDVKNAQVDNDDKDIIYVAGIIKHFQTDETPYTLYFNGKNISTGEDIRRKIKLSKKVKGYRSDNSNLVIPESDYPKRDEIYKAKLMVETWSWNGKSCMRILAFELEKYLGKNEQYTNPFHDEKLSTNVKED